MDENSKEKPFDVENVKGLLKQSTGVVLEVLRLQEEKIKVLINFLEYAEALTTDKETAARIKNVLIDLEVWDKN